MRFFVARSPYLNEKRSFDKPNHSYNSLPSFSFFKRLPSFLPFDVFDVLHFFSQKNKSQATTQQSNNKQESKLESLFFKIFARSKYDEPFHLPRCRFGFFISHWFLRSTIEQSCHDDIDGKCFCVFSYIKQDATTLMRAVDY